MTAMTLSADQRKARQRRNLWLALAHVALAVAFVAGFVWSVSHPG